LSQYPKSPTFAAYQPFITMNLPSNSIYVKILSISSLAIAATLILKLFVFGADKSHPPVVYDANGQPQTHIAVAYPLPENPTFAGEPLPIDRQDIRESLDREITVNTYWHSQTILWMKRANRYFPIIEPILKEQGVPDDFKYLAMIESNLMPTAQSPANAVGIWQFIKEAGKQYGLEVDVEVDERYNIEKATVAACKYLKDSYARFGNWTTAAASYNAGSGGVSKQQTRQMEKNYYDLIFGEETGRYVFRIVAAKEILSNPTKYGFHIDESTLYPPFEYTEIEVSGPLPSIATFAKANGTTYKQVKLLNPWLREASLTNKYGKTYKIKVPKRS
jgi:membrane-bound lytic murein transglycosylase D